MNMGIATFIVGVLTAEAFGFVIEKWDAFVWLYEPMSRIPSTYLQIQYS